jgi:hypothetical protein
MGTELLVVTILKALCELAGLFMLGQGMLYVLAGHKRDQNLFYQVFRLLTSPVVKTTRLITPRIVLDKHIPFVGFILLFWLWVLFTAMKVQICAEVEHRCRPQEAAAVSWPGQRISV